MTAGEDDYCWPPFIPLDSPRLPTLDMALIPGWAGDYVRALAAATETPPELAGAMVLASCSAAVAPSVEVAVSSDYRELCNLWVLAALPPGTRKSAVQSWAARPLTDWEREQARKLGPEIEKAKSKLLTMEARVKELRHRAAREKDPVKAEKYAAEAAELESGYPQLPVVPQIWTSDATPERLGSLLAEQGECIAWLSSEGGIFELLQGRYSNGIPNLDLVLKSHSGDSERVDRGSRPPVYLNRPRVTMGVSPQPDVLRGLGSIKGFRGRGLLARFLFFLPDSNLGHRTFETEEIPPAVRDAYRDGLYSMLNWRELKPNKEYEILFQLVLSNPANDIWHEFALEIESEMGSGGILEHFRDWGGKAPGAALRVAGVLHCIEYAHERPWELPLTAATLSAATDIVRTSMHHSIAAFSMMGADPAVAAAQSVWSWINRQRLVEFSVRDAFNGLRGRFQRVSELKAAMQVLADHGYISVAESSSGGVGRPRSPSVSVRPDLAAKWK